MIVYGGAILCVVALALGQILFKLSATFLSESGTFFSFKPAALFLAAIFLYGIASIAWVFILQKVELGRVYPVMAMAFVLVPLGSHFIFDERFNFQYFIGVAIIIVGILISVRA